MLTRYRPGLFKFTSQALWGTTSDISAFLFLKASDYRRVEPFSNVFSVTSGLVFTQQPTLDDLAALPTAELVTHLSKLSGHHLPNPLENTRKLQRAASESFALDDDLVLPVQRILELTLAHIRFLESQLQQVNQWNAAEQASYPEIAQLATIPGVGPVFTSGIAAEIGRIQRFLQPLKWDQRCKRY